MEPSQVRVMSLRILQQQALEDIPLVTLTVHSAWDVIYGAGMVMGSLIDCTLGGLKSQDWLRGQLDMDKAGDYDSPAGCDSRRTTHSLVNELPAEAFR